MANALSSLYKQIPKVNHSLKRMNLHNRFYQIRVQLVAMPED